METMRTITFENGTKYAVNAPIVEVSGELSEEGTNIDFGTFKNGLTEVDLISIGASGGQGTYFYITINGTKSGFITYSGIYTRELFLHMKKIAGSLWLVYGTNAGDMISYVSGILNAGVDKITSLSIQAYESNSKFAAGHKFALEGR